MAMLKEVYLTPLEAKELIQYFLNVYKYTKADISYLTWISRMTIDKILNDKCVYIQDNVQKQLLTAYENINPRMYRTIIKQKGFNKFFITLKEHLNIKKEQAKLKMIMLEHRDEWKEWEFYIEDIIDRDKSKSRKGLLFYPRFEEFLNSWKYLYLKVDLTYLNYWNRNTNVHMLKVLISHFLLDKRDWDKKTFLWINAIHWPKLYKRNFIFNY